MTTEEETEVQHIIETRLGILCGAAEPTEEQRNLAEEEALDWLRSQQCDL